VLPFFHPAAALRQTKVMDAFMADVLKLPKILEYVRAKHEELDEISTIQDAMF
jgi:hypothetical protein